MNYCYKKNIRIIFSSFLYMAVSYSYLVLPWFTYSLDGPGIKNKIHPFTPFFFCVFFFVCLKSGWESNNWFSLALSYQMSFICFWWLWFILKWRYISIKYRYSFWIISGVIQIHVAKKNDSLGNVIRYGEIFILSIHLFLIDSLTFVFTVTRFGILFLTKYQSLFSGENKKIF